MDLLRILSLIFICDVVKSINSNSKSVEIFPKVLHRQTEQKSPLKDVSISYVYKGENVILDLELNRHLMPKDHFLSYQKPNDTYEDIYYKTDTNNCHYHGNIRYVVSSSVSLSTCDGIKGIVFDGRETFYIDFLDNEESGSKHRHFLTRRCDVIHNSTCGISDEALLVEKFEKNALKNLRVKRSSSGIHSPSNANRDSNYVELVLVLDNSMFKKLDKSLAKAHQFTKDLVNIMNGFYKPLNVFIALKGVVVWNVRDEIDMVPNIDAVLKSFLRYRETILLKKYTNDNAQLLTNLKLDSSAVGLATVSGICSPSLSGGVSQDHIDRIQIVAATVAHEMGHNLGMKHDRDDCRCNDKNGCIMYGVSSHLGHNQWSSCSVNQFRDLLESGNGECLKNKPEKLFDSPTCGNGFVEPGEECDCGLKQYCDNKCCNPDTCMFSTNSTCATGKCCDLETCSLKSSNDVCREAFSECDLPEFCNGEDEFCPADVYKHNSVECGNGKAYCYEGHCQSHDDQCRKIWGPSSNSHNKCYERINIKGNDYGHCGYDEFGRYKPCPKNDSLCGMLQCESRDGEVRFKVGHKLTYTSTFYDGICWTALFDPVETGLVPNGAKCGNDKVCSNQRCVDINELKSKCADCNGNGVCNSKGNCHCDAGWAPPYCTEPGDGGSIDNQRKTDEDSSNLVLKISLILLSIVALCGLSFVAVKTFQRYSTKSKSNNNSFKKLTPLPTRTSDGKSTLTIKLLNNAPSTEDLISKPLLSSVESLKLLTDHKVVNEKTLDRKNLPKPPPPPMKPPPPPVKRPTPPMKPQTLLKPAKPVPLRNAPPPPVKKPLDEENPLKTHTTLAAKPSLPSTRIQNNKIKETIEKFNQVK